jgi:hypothetical protein
LEAVGVTVTTVLLIELLARLSPSGEYGALHYVHWAADIVLVLTAGFILARYTGFYNPWAHRRLVYPCLFSNVAVVLSGTVLLVLLPLA